MTDRIRRIRRRHGGEKGQVFPVLLVLVLSVLGLGVALFQVGRATTMRAQAQAGADAAALAGANQIRDHVVAVLGARGLVARDQIGPNLVLSALRSGPGLTDQMQTSEGIYADRNGTHVTAAAWPSAFDALVEVTTNESLHLQADHAHADGKTAAAQSRARVGIRFLPLPPIPPPPPVIIVIPFFGVIVIPPAPQAPAPPPPPVNPLDYIRFAVRLVPLQG